MKYQETELTKEQKIEVLRELKLNIQKKEKAYKRAYICWAWEDLFGIDMDFSMENIEIVFPELYNKIIDTIKKANRRDSIGYSLNYQVRYDLIDKLTEELTPEILTK